MLYINENNEREEASPVECLGCLSDSRRPGAGRAAAVGRAAGALPGTVRAAGVRVLAGVANEGLVVLEVPAVVEGPVIDVLFDAAVL